MADTRELPTGQQGTPHAYSASSIGYFRANTGIPVSTTHWEFNILSKTFQKTQSTVSSVLTDVWADRKNNMKFLVQRISAGTRGFSSKTFYTSGDYPMKYPQGENTTDFEVTFFETADRQVQKFFEDWFALIKHPVAKIYYPQSDYKYDAELTFGYPSNELFNPTEEKDAPAQAKPDPKRPLFKISMSGAFPLNIGNVSLDYQSAKTLLLGVKFSCDFAKFEPIPQTPTSTTQSSTSVPMNQSSILNELNTTLSYRHR